MPKIIVFPNNSISIDGEDYIWTDEEFQKFDIRKVRPSYRPEIPEKRELTVSGIFYSIEIYPTSHRKNGTKKYKPINGEKS